MRISAVEDEANNREQLVGMIDNVQLVLFFMCHLRKVQKIIIFKLVKC